MILIFRKSFLFFCLFLSSFVQAQRIAMEPAYWQYNASSVEFITQDGLKAAHLKDGTPFIPKNVQFANGTIEYDVALKLGFPGISFRVSKDGRNADQFYLRYFGNTSPESRTTMQYTAVIDSMNMWDMTDEYQAGTKLNIPGWNHVKLVISGKQLKAYVNDMTRPALLVPMLEGSETKGGLAFSGGDVIVTNFVVRPDATEGLDPAPGYVPPYNDTRYLRNWQVSKPIDFPFGREVAAFLPGRGVVHAPEYPDSTASWKPVWAGPRGIVNLTQPLGATAFGQRRLAWVKTTIESDKVQERTLQLGFSDEIWLFVNGNMVCADKNLFNTPAQKFPAGRCTIENSSVKLPLQQGKNEILIAVANYFYGWGVIARLDDTEGIHLP